MQASTGLVILAHLLWEGPLFGACPRSLQQCTQFAREQKEKKHALPSPAAPHDGLQELVLGEVAKGGTVLEGGAGVARADRPDPSAASSSASVTCTPATTRYFK